MPNPRLREEARVQAIYMEALAEAAREKAKTLSVDTSLNFDPQGRLVIDVELTDNEINAIMAKINAGRADLAPIRSDKVGLLQALAPLKLSAATTVSLDISKTKDLERLRDQFINKLLGHLQRAGANNPQLITDNLAALENKGSIIALQQEFHFHLSLVGRVYQSIDPKIPHPQMAKIHKQAMDRVNELVMDAYAKALIAATDEAGNIDIAKLNTVLDKARKKIMPQAQDFLVEEIVRETGIIFTPKQLKDIKHKAEATTATPNDLLHIDPEQGLITLIGGSEFTSHERKTGTDFAHRPIVTHQLIDEGTIVSPHTHPRIQIRTPSPVVKEGLESQSDYYTDAAQKLAAITKEYGLRERLSGGGAADKPKAFIYNSYTALNDALGDTKGNLQTPSAGHILVGAHALNSWELNNNGDNAVFCLPQNISVNGFGDTLGYDQRYFPGFRDILLDESTLMAEMALMHTLYDVSTPDEQARISQAFNQYKEYLRNPKDKLFAQSPEGKEARKIIQDIKNSWKSAPPKAAGDDLFKNAQLALKNLTAHDHHMSHEHSKLFQALSVFVEEASIGGCKSGNERAQAINGRVAVFDKALLVNLPLIKDAIQQLASARTPEAVMAAATQLKTEVDTEYNANGQQAAASLISLADQGAAAKVMAKIKSFYEAIVNFKLLAKLFDRNYAEESTMSNNQQSRAGAMQAHKEMTPQMKASCGEPVTWWNRMKSNALGAAGAIIGTVIFPIAIGVALYNAYDNTQIADKRQAKLQGLQKKYIETHPVALVVEHGDEHRVEHGQEHGHGHGDEHVQDHGHGHEDQSPSWQHNTSSVTHVHLPLSGGLSAEQIRQGVQQIRQDHQPELSALVDKLAMPDSSAQQSGYHS